MAVFGNIPVYRYRITQGEGDDAFDLIMDIAGDSVDQVSYRIYIIIGVAVLVALGLVLVVSISMPVTLRAHYHAWCVI